MQVSKKYDCLFESIFRAYFAFEDTIGTKNVLLIAELVTSSGKYLQQPDIKGQLKERHIYRMLRL